MMNLIVPPIIVVIAVATLIIFLTRIATAEKKDAGRFVLRDTNRLKKGITQGRTLFREAGGDAKNLIKETIKNTIPEKLKTSHNSKTTQGIILEKNSEQVVSLRKRSMVSDKIENAEGRDAQELSLMKEIESDPQNSKKYEQLGDYYMEREQFADARDCYKYVLRLDPRHKRAQVAMKNLDRVL